MHSFKQFLKEDNSNFRITNSIDIRITNVTNYQRDEFNDATKHASSLISDFCKKFNKIKFESFGQGTLGTGDYALVIRVDIKDISFLKNEKIFSDFQNDIIQMFNEKWKSLNFKFHSNTCYLHDNIPSSPIDVDDLKFILKFSQNMTLHDIHKYISCKTLILQNMKHLTGNVLGLLKIKKLEKLSIDVSGTYDIKSVRAIEIINNHLKSRDILSCQEELIENGLEEYAKL